MNYWQECISEAFDDANINATEEQIKAVAHFVEGAHENYGMAYGHDCIPNPLVEENNKLKKQLKEEENKTVCKECRGEGHIITVGPHHSSDSECWHCGGEGKK